MLLLFAVFQFELEVLDLGQQVDFAVRYSIVYLLVRSWDFFKFNRALLQNRFGFNCLERAG